MCELHPLVCAGGYGIATAGVALFMHEKQRAKAANSSIVTRP